MSNRAMSQPTSSTDKTHFQKFRFAYALLSVSIVVVLAFFPSEEKTVSRSVLAIAHPTPGSSLIATLKTNTLHGHDDDEIRIEAATAVGTRIENVKVCVNSPDFTPDPESGCIPVNVSHKADVIALQNPAVIRMKAKKTYGTSKILVSVSWWRYIPRQQTIEGRTKSKPSIQSCEGDQSTCYPISEKVEMTLGPVDLGIDKVARFGGRLSRFFKDLTLPIILIFLANRLTREASERDRRRKGEEEILRGEQDRKEKDDQERHRMLEREQEEEKQIAHILLPKVMRLSGHYYLPIAANLKRFLRISQDRSSSPSEQVFFILSTFHVARSLKEKEGGVFFKDMAGEQLFTIANNLVRALIVRAVGGEKLYMDLLDFLDTWLPDGVKRWPRLAEQPDSMPETWKKLQDWLVHMESNQYQAVRFLFSVLLGVLRYESNAPYVHWYSNSKAKNLFEMREHIAPPGDAVFGSEFSGDVGEFLRLLDAYRFGKEN